MAEVLLVGVFMDADRGYLNCDNVIRDLMEAISLLPLVEKGDVDRIKWFIVHLMEKLAQTWQHCGISV